MPDFSSPASSMPQLSPDASPRSADHAIDAAAANEDANSAPTGSGLRSVGVTPGDPDSRPVAPQSAARRQLFQSDRGDKADGHRATPHRDAESCSRAGSKDEWQSPESHRLSSGSPEAEANASESEDSPPIVAQSTIRKGRKPAFEEPSPAQASPTPLRVWHWRWSPFSSLIACWEAFHILDSLESICFCPVCSEAFTVHKLLRRSQQPSRHQALGMQATVQEMRLSRHCPPLSYPLTVTKRTT